MPEVRREAPEGKVYEKGGPKELEDQSYREKANFAAHDAIVPPDGTRRQKKPDGTLFSKNLTKEIRCQPEMRQFGSFLRPATIRHGFPKATVTVPNPAKDVRNF